MMIARKKFKILEYSTSREIVLEQDEEVMMGPNGHFYIVNWSGRKPPELLSLRYFMYRVKFQ